ncbi:hypothetical protein L195_g060491, partial [Trifolium pratense]
MNNAGEVASNNELQPRLTPKPEKVVEIVTETKEVIEVQRGKNQVFVFEPLPTPEPPVLDASIKTLLEPKPPDLLSPELLQSKSQDSDQLATMLPRRGPTPEPPGTNPPQSPVANILMVGKDSIPNEPRDV